MIKIVSGGQTGVDRGALDAALEAGVACGGWCPAGRLAEDGVIDNRYPLTPLASDSYAERTRKNVEDSDATLVIYYAEPDGGTALTVTLCEKLGRPHLLIDAAQVTQQAAADRALAFVKSNRIAILNVAGPRASKQPGGHAYTRAVVRALLNALVSTAGHQGAGL